MNEEPKSNGYQIFKGEDGVKRFIGFLTDTYKYREGEVVKVVVEVKCARPSCKIMYDREFGATDLLNFQKQIQQKQSPNLEEVCSTCFMGTKE